MKRGYFHFPKPVASGVRLRPNPLAKHSFLDARRSTVSVPFLIRLLSAILTLTLFFSGSPALFASAARDVMGGGGGKGSSANLQNAGAASASLTATRAREVLKQTDAQVAAMKALQASARSIMTQSSYNGLEPNGLVPSATATWSGASINSGNSYNVNIKQTTQNAYLYWDKFNVGSQTTLNFDQRAGGNDAANWIAFNKVMGNVKTDVFGSITAQGQVYILNQNGILFHNGAQVNTHVLVASSLPINPYLAGDSLTGINGVGILNNPGYQFLFSALKLNNSAAAQDGFAPNPNDPSGSLMASQIGQVLVEKGASLSSPVDANNVGGRVMLVGPSVVNKGSISTPNGQTILAAGLQVGVNPHAAGAANSDPSLRGLDVYVGKVKDGNGQTLDNGGNPVGSVENTGQIAVPLGDVAVVGRSILQNGIIDSSTSTSLNGRVDLLAAYNAVLNPNPLPAYYYDSTAQDGTTGTIELGSQSVIRILPEWSSAETTVGTSLALPSLVNVKGRSIQMAGGAVIFAPGADKSPDSTSPFYDMTFPSRYISEPQAPIAISAQLGSGINILAGNYNRPVGKNYSYFQIGSVNSSPAGNITIGNGAQISAAGSTGVTVDSSQNYLNLQMRGAEFANSPLQRGGTIRGASITLDARLSGTYNGQYWVGTPLGDATGYAGLIERTVGELTAAGGSISLIAGDSVNLAQGAVLDVSGGWMQYAGGMASTSKVIYQGHLMDISQATPDRVYSGIYSGGGTVEKSTKWGVTKTFGDSPLDPTAKHYEGSYLSGAAGGSITIEAPSIALNGDALGTVVNGPRQVRSTSLLSTLAAPSELTLNLNDSSLGSLYRPSVTFAPGGSTASPRETFIDPVMLSAGGIGYLTVNNYDGNIDLPKSVSLDMPAGALGGVTLLGQNVTLEGSILAPGGTISVTASPYTQDGGVNQTSPHGTIHLAEGATLSTAGVVAKNQGPNAFQSPVVSTGGTITLNGYQVNLDAGSLLDVSGGGLLNASSSSTAIYGNAGSVSILGGQGVVDSSVIPGTSVQLNGAIIGYAGPGAKSGTFSLSAPAIQIGGSISDARVMEIAPQFFSQGGFSTFSFTGIGFNVGTLGDPNYREIPGIRVAAGAIIDPQVHNRMILGDGKFMDVVEPSGMQPAPSLTLNSLGIKGDNPLNPYIVRGETIIESGSKIILNPQISFANDLSSVATVNVGSLTIGALVPAGGQITKVGQIAEIDGLVSVPGGNIIIDGASSYPNNYNGGFPSQAYPTLVLGSSASVSVAGEAVYMTDFSGRGRLLGSVLPGGSVSMDGNIYLNSGSVVDVSGASGKIYVRSLITDASGASNNGRQKLSKLTDFSPTTQVDSGGGKISLTGDEFLVSAGTLLGKSGGSDVTGGALSVSSGHFYSDKSVVPAEELLTGINLQVSQNLNGLGDVVNRQVAITQNPISTGNEMLSHGYFAAQTAMDGGFDTLNLKGNVQFIGPVTIDLPGSILVASKGVLSADSTVQLTAPYVALGTPLAGPLIPQSVVGLGVFKAPTYGTGSLAVTARIIDVGNLLLENIGKALLDASGGVIRGDGGLDIAGDLTLKAAQIYPATETRFTLAAYDHSGTPGSITVQQVGGALPLPLSAGGTISLYASTINQNGTLVAPFGNINLGWDGTGTSPTDPISGAGQVGAAAALPVTANLILGPQSVTSVSAIDPTTGQGITIPYGIIINGSQWIDPSGIDITQTGLPPKGVNLSATSIATEAGSSIDLRGGGNLAAFQWISGLQGTIDPTSQPIEAWSGKNYQVGQKVTENGVIYSARSSSTTAQPEPTKGANWQSYWSKVTESYAILPNFGSDLMPIAPFAQVPNPTTGLSTTGGDPGYVSSSLSIGDKITLSGGAGLPAGTYTLLPSRYAVLPGAYLITPAGQAQESQPSSVVRPDGSVMVSGIRFNDLNAAAKASPVTSLYAIESPAVLAKSAQIELFSPKNVLPVSQSASPVNNAGTLVIQATAAMSLMGGLMGGGANGGLGANVDLSSSDNFLITGNAGAAPQANTIVLSAPVLSSWDAGSLLVGGIRTISSSGQSVTPSTSKITVDDAGSILSASEVILTSQNGITLANGASISATGSAASTPLTVNGNGALIRVSSDPNASTTRSFTYVPGNISEGLVIQSDGSLAGSSITLNSSGKAALDSSAVLNATTINVAVGGIAINFNQAAVGSDVLNLTGNGLSSLSTAQKLNISSYSSIDFHGSGVLGSASLGSLGLHAGEILGDNAAADTILASSILFDNANGSTDPSAGAPSASGGSLTISGSILTLGAGNLSFGGFQDITGNLTGGVQSSGKGSLVVAENLTLNTPILTGAGSSVTTITAGGDLNVSSYGSSLLTPGLGESLSLKGSSVSIGAPITLPSGSLSLDATSGNLTISSILDVGGKERQFFDHTEYTSGGAINLSAANGNINLTADSTLNLSAPDSAGSAGSLSVSATKGTASFGGSIDATAPKGTAGSFTADLKSYDSGDLTALEGNLTEWGFTQSQNIRLRSGDVLVGHGDVTVVNVKAHSYTLSADGGSITVNGKIDASGNTGGSISLFAGNSVTLTSGAELDAHGEIFNNAGKGGSVDLEAGNSLSAAVIDTTPQLDGSGKFTVGSVVDLTLGTIDLYVGSDPMHQLAPGLGQTSGTLHLRAPQTADNSDVQINPIGATITGASAINIEGFYRQDAVTVGNAVIDPGTQDPVLDYQNNAMNNASAFMANYASIQSRISTSLSAANQSIMQINPGEEIVNSLGGLVLNNDWDLSLQRYGDLLTVLDSSGNPIPWSGAGPQDVNGNQAIGQNAGFLTLRASGDITFNGSLSDGFGDSVNNAANAGGHNYGLYLAPLLPIVSNASGLLKNQQSWSYRISSGNDMSAANPLATAGSGNVNIGKLTATSNINLDDPAGYQNQTRQSVDGYYQSIRTGTGNISISSAGSIQILNQFSTIYTAGSQAVDPTLNGQFDIPNFYSRSVWNNSLGSLQQPNKYGAVQYSYNGGNVELNAGANIAHLQAEQDPNNLSGPWLTAPDGSYLLQADSSHELPSGWLSRSGYLDASGNWGGLPKGGIATTTWWINFGNFFEGVGALGGGNVSMIAQGNISNVDAVVPTQARMTKDGRLAETGGGDLLVKAGGNLDAGVYYVERGNANIQVGGSIVSNPTRNAQGAFINYLLDPSNNAASLATDPKTWIPTSFVLGKGNISVFSGSDALLGPIANAFLLAPGINNGLSSKSYFSTFDQSNLNLDGSAASYSSSFSATSLSGNITWRTVVDGSSVLSPATPLTDFISIYQPWTRVSESNPQDLNLQFAASLLPPRIQLTAMSGAINLQGGGNLQPAVNGTLSLYAQQSINGIYDTGNGYSSSVINISDASPSIVSSISAPLAQAKIDSNNPGYLVNNTDSSYLSSFVAGFAETGAYLGNQQPTLQAKLALHDVNLLHSGDNEPVRIYSSLGDLSGIQLFSPKVTDIVTGGNISNIAFYVQNDSPGSISIISAGGNINPYDTTTVNLTAPLNGDIQISGPGTLEVLAGGNVNLGKGDQNTDGTGAGIISIGNARNPAPALGFTGADVIVAAGIGLPPGLSSSSLNTMAFLDKLASMTDSSRYFGELQTALADTGNNGLTDSLDSHSISSIGDIATSSLSAEVKARLALQLFYIVLRDAGRDHNKAGSAGYGNYAAGEAAIQTFINESGTGNILMNSRDIRTKSGGAINLLTPSGGVSLSPYAVSASLIPPGIVTEDGGSINIYTQQSVSIGIGRIFTLRGGDITIWSDKGDIAAGSSSKTVASAPPTRVILDPQSGNVKTDLAGLATGGGIGVLATVAGVAPGNVDLIAPSGVIDAGDAGIRSSGNLNLAATKILNADNIAATGTTSGAPPAAPPPAAPNISGASAASTAGAASTSAAETAAKNNASTDAEPPPSVISVEVLGYGGGDGTEGDSSASTPAASSGNTPPPQASL